MSARCHNFLIELRKKREGAGAERAAAFAFFSRGCQMCVLCVPTPIQALNNCW